MRVALIRSMLVSRRAQQGGPVRSVFLQTLMCAAVIGAVGAPLHAGDGVLIVQRTTSGDTVQTHEVQIEKTRMRVELDIAGTRQVVIFDAAKQVMDLVNVDLRAYREVTKGEIERMADQTAQVQTMMSGLPGAQREQMQELLGEGPAASAAGVGVNKTEYRRAGTERVGQWTCNRYQGYQNGQKISEVCTVDPKVLGFSPDEFDVTRQVADLLQKLVPQTSAQVFRIGRAQDHGFAGIPVKSVVTIAGRPMTVELIKATHESFPDALFVVPAGFQKQEKPAAPSRGRGDSSR